MAQEPREESAWPSGSHRVLLFMLIACIIWIAWMLVSGGVFGGPLEGQP